MESNTAVNVGYDNYEEHYRRSGNRPVDLAALKAGPRPTRIWFPAERHARILDVGCGLGHQLGTFVAAGYSRLWGIDQLKETCALAKQSLGDHAQIHCADAISWLDTCGQTFDLIVSNDVIEHIPPDKLRTFLRALRNALDTNGTLVLRTPNMGTILGSYSRYIDITHLSGFSAMSLVQLLESAGFESPKFVSDFAGAASGVPAPWSPLKPWRNLRLRTALNHIVHRALFWLRGQHVVYPVFGQNLEVYCTRGGDK